MPLLTEMLSLPFMQRALIAGVILGLLLAALGIIATLRKMAFFGEGVAHASLAGIALAVIADFSPLPLAITWALAIAMIIFALERYTKLASDTLIGILFTTSMALGVIIMSFSQGYQPELLSFLFGSILTIQLADLILIAALAAIILTWYFTSLRSLVYMSLSPESATTRGIKVGAQTFCFYLALAVATVLGVKILGIILVSALIILPAATARLLTASFKSYALLSILLSIIIIVCGLIVSYLYDLPSGATVVLVGSLFFTIAALSQKITAK